MNNTYVVIMAGGVGTRFWPFSRTGYPKQFHDVLGSGQSLLQQTASRFEGICPPEHIYVVTADRYRTLCHEQLPQLSPDQILCEPVARNTAPCIAYACYKIAQQNPQANIVVAPADHIILNETEFQETIRVALNATANQDVLVTLGIRPSRPDTGYGYIQYMAEPDDVAQIRVVRKVKTFTEKPQLELAQQFIAVESLSGTPEFLSGMSKASSGHLPKLCLTWARFSLKVTKPIIPTAKTRLSNGLTRSAAASRLTMALWKKPITCLWS